MTHPDIQAAHEWLEAEERKRDERRKARRAAELEYQRRLALRAKYRAELDRKCGWSDYRQVHP